MQVKPINHNSFQGIRLSSHDYNKTRDIAMQLEKHGYNCLGHRTFVCNNTLKDKINLAKQIREKACFFKNHFGTIFLPWSKEAYLMSSPIDEQKMFAIVKMLDKDAKINLAI